MTSLTLCRHLNVVAIAASASTRSTSSLPSSLSLRRQFNLQQQQHQSQNRSIVTVPTTTTSILDYKNAYAGVLRRNMSSTSNLVAVAESRRFMIDCFVSVNVPLAHAEQQADLLVAADYRGHFSHGMNRLEMYINDLIINSTAGGAVPQILKESPATAWVDGCNGLGAVVGNYCMALAIKKAKNVGVGWVCVKGSNHYGMAGWYVMQAMKEGLVGMSMTNTSPLMAPTRSKQAALGTNPLALGAPAGQNDKFLLDMATTAVAVGKIEIQRRKAVPLPDGWAQDPEGNITNDAELGFKTACLMPLGGAEINSGYKGYGLGAMVDILTGVMSGANYTTKVRKWTHAGANTAANLGHVFIAIDPNSFAPGFEEHMVDFNSRLRNSAPTDPNNPVLVAGDKEEHNMKSVDDAGGIEYLENQIKTCSELAKTLNVKPMRFISESSRTKVPLS